MRRVLFDENLPRLLQRHLQEFAVRTVQEEGWGSLNNGALLRRAEESFDVFLTADRRMQYQQKLTAYAIGVVVIVTPSLQLQVLEGAAEQLRVAIATVKSGEIVHVRTR